MTYSNHKGLFLNEDGVLDKTRVILGSAMVLFLVGVITFITYDYLTG
ncbi:hypothetical protein ACFSYB_20050 [Litchfieldia salsa]